MLFIIATTVKCQKEQSFDAPETIVTTPKNPITANLQGIVLDENGAPTTGALVIVGTKTATTGANGFFRILNASLDKSASMVKIEKAGYFVGYRTFMATAGSNHVKVKLVKKQLIATVNAASGGAATLANGAKITLQANGVVKKAGGAFTGDVQVYAAYIDPTAADIAETLPGSFMADDKDNKRVTLKSFGMLAVELESASGEKLQISPGKTAELKTPIPATLLASSPATIPLWYVDELTGLWKEQGSATKVGNNYVGDVSHFSFWNYDISFPAVTLQFKVVTTSGLPLINTSINLDANSFGSIGGHTDGNGAAIGFVPANQNLILRINNGCDLSVFTLNIGSLSQNTNLGNIVITNPTQPIIEVFGNVVNCSGQPVSNGEVLITYNNSNTYYTYYHNTYTNVNSNGNFAYAFLKCNPNPTTIGVLGIDNTTQQQGIINSFTLNNTNFNVGTIIACGNSSSQFINYTLDGTNYSITNLVDSSRASTSNSATSFYSSLNFMDIISSKNIRLGFTGNSQIPGSYAITDMNVQNHYLNPLSGSTINITNFPLNIAEFFEGNFTASYYDYPTPTIVHNINGNFRIRRAQ